jgi:hypothetical protein
VSGREGSRPEIGTAPTELAQLPPRRERTDEHWPPPPTRTIRSFRDVESVHDLIRRDISEHQRALGYVEDKADRALREIHGEGEEPGLRGLVLVLTKSVRTTQVAMLVLLSVIAASLVYMAMHVGPQ